MKSQPFLANPRKRATIGLALSLLLHALILFRFTTQAPPMDLSEPGPKGNAPLTVRLLPMTPPSAPSTASAPQQRSVLAPPPMAKQPQRQPRQKQSPAIAQKKTPAPKAALNKSLPPEPTASKKLPPTSDISDMLAAARERRRAAGIEDPDTSEQEPQDDNAIARANIQHMMQMQSHGQQESGGVFQITYKGVRTAEFIFRGWNVRRRNDTRQLIQVDAGLNGDVDTAIVRRMIELIRQTERGDFHWESRRLGRVVVLSARPQDSAELEDFLKKEFRLSQ